MFFYKKFFRILLCFFIFNTFLNPVFSDYEIDILAPSAILMEPQTGKILYEKNINEKRSCASITKVMTLILVMEALDEGKISLSENVIASEHASSMGGSDIWLENGESMTVDELLKAVVVASANDAAVALAEHISGSEDKFVYEMNRKAKDLGMENTTFKNCNGLDEDGHLTTAYDISLMARELIKHKAIFDYTSIWIDYLRDGKTQLVNTNKLLKTYKGITGLKTGTTSVAGCCFVATAKREKLNLIAVILGEANSKDRFTDAASLLDFGFANYVMLTPSIDESILTPVKVIGGMKGSVNVKINNITDVLIFKGREKNVTNSIELCNEISAPIKEGQCLGKLRFKDNDEIISEYDIVSSDAVEKISFNLILNKMFKMFVML